MNALKHGLNLPIERDPIYGERVERLATFLAGNGANEDELDCAHRIALAQMEVARSRGLMREVFVKPMRSKIRMRKYELYAKLEQFEANEPGASERNDFLDRVAELIFWNISEEPIYHLRVRLSEMERLDRRKK